MRAVLQRVTEAEVRVGREVVGRLDRPGILALVGVTHSDDETTAHRLADKLWRLRILDGERAAADCGAPLLVVSQFTLYADTSRGRRPSWSAAAPAEQAAPLVDEVIRALRAAGAEVATGRFGAHMELRLVNDGPVTLVVDA